MRITPLLATVFLASAGLAGAQVINIDFDKSDSIVTYQGYAAAPDPSGGTAFWNSVSSAGNSINATNLIDSDGQITGVGVELDINGSFLSAPGEQELGGASNAFAGLMSDYVYLSAPTTSDIVTKLGTITGLEAGKLYDIYLYGQGDKFNEILYSEGQNTLFTLNGIAKQTSWDGVAGGNGILDEGTEYVKYSVNADVNGEIAFIWENVVSGPGGNVTVDADGANSRFAAINGIQIVDVAAVPEPGAALLGAAGLLLLMRRRR